MKDALDSGRQRNAAVARSVDDEERPDSEDLESLNTVCLWPAFGSQLSRVESACRLLRSCKRLAGAVLKRTPLFGPPSLQGVSAFPSSSSGESLSRKG